MKINLTMENIKKLGTGLMVLAFLGAVVGVSLMKSPEAPKNEANDVPPILAEIEASRTITKQNEVSLNKLAMAECENVKKRSGLLIAASGLDYIQASVDEDDTWRSQKEMDCSKATYQLAF